MLKSLLGLAYFLFSMLIFLYIWSTLRMDDPNLQYVTTGFIYPLLVAIIKILFLTALNKAWSYEESTNNVPSGSSFIQYSNKFNFSSMNEGKKWFTCRNISCSLKIPNLVLIFLTSEAQTTTKFTTNVALAFGMELAGSLISLSRFSSFGIKVVNKASSTIKQNKIVGEVIGEAVNEVMDGAGDVVADILSPSPPDHDSVAPHVATLDRIKPIDKAAYKFVNEDVGELMANLLSLPVSLGISIKFNERTIEIQQLCVRGAIMLGFEFVVGFVKSLARKRMGVNTANVHNDINIWDAGNAAFNSLAVIFIIYAAFFLMN